MVFTYVVDGIYKSDVKLKVGNFYEWLETQAEKINEINKDTFYSQNEPFMPLRKSQVLFILRMSWGSWGQCTPFKRDEGIRKKIGKCRLQPIFNGRNMWSRVNYDDELTKFYLKDDFEISCHSMKLKELFPAFSRIVRSLPDFEANEPCVVANKNLSDFGQITTGSDRDESVTKISMQVAENGHCILICAESAFGSNLHWYKDNQLLNTSFRNNMADEKEEPHISIDTSNILYILHATKNEEGSYICTIDNAKTCEYFIKVVSMAKTLDQDFIRYSIYLGFVLSLTATCYCAGLCVAWHRRASFADPLNLYYNNYKKKFEDSNDAESKALLVRK